MPCAAVIGSCGALAGCGALGACGADGDTGVGDGCGVGDGLAGAGTEGDGDGDAPDAVVPEAGGDGIGALVGAGTLITTVTGETGAPVAPLLAAAPLVAAGALEPLGAGAAPTPLVAVDVVPFGGVAEVGAGSATGIGSGVVPLGHVDVPDPSPSESGVQS